MKICFITPNNFSGKVPRNFKNCRTEYAWMIALDAPNVPIYNLVNPPTYSNTPPEYDLGIFILPKKLDGIHWLNILANANQFCKKVALMQEGPQWYYQDYPYTQQIEYVNFIQAMNVLLVHNKSDISYFKGMFKKPTFNLPSLMIEDGLRAENISAQPNGKPIIGGNFCSWYSGIDSYFVALNFQQPIAAPSMGRKIDHEEHIPNLQHLPYLEWLDWMKALSQFSYGVHLMRTHAAGTFALNCAYFGIPCIGYKGLDTQQTLHPALTVDVGDIDAANTLAIKLKTNKEFYNFCSTNARSNYRESYNETAWKLHWDSIYDKIKD